MRMLIWRCIILKDSISSKFIFFMDTESFLSALFSGDKYDELLELVRNESNLLIKITCFATIHKTG
jgi:hypothetical protein